MVNLLLPAENEAQRSAITNKIFSPTFAATSFGLWKQFFFPPLIPLIPIRTIELYNIYRLSYFGGIT